MYLNRCVLKNQYTIECKTMKGKKYELLKAFDCQNGMPMEVKNAFFESTHATNDVYLEWDVLDKSYYSETLPDAQIDNRKTVDNWLIENDCEKGETILIKRWW